MQSISQILRLIFKRGELDCFYVECGEGDGPDTTRLQAAVIRDPAGGLPEERPKYKVWMETMCLKLRLSRFS
ncbi:uncharacterized protein Dana_GF27810, isoform B [Drosophila ananassae]|uniref:Uncharacterized protein, isoform B n=1 Tax=Drosophila ananassae TaxID=7217 RepID=A0A0P8XXB5_DROAN|nr:uncharacterized protein Dana_GF27810, isoform B [Drosophila ananassae]